MTNYLVLITYHYLPVLFDIPLVPSSYCSRKSLTITFNWVKASDVDLCSYAMHTFQHFKSIPINCAIKCDDVNCSSPEYRQMIDLLYSQICCALEQSSQKTIPSSNIRDGRDYIVPGFNDFMKELHTSVRNDYNVWRNAGRPRSGPLCSDMKRSRLRFTYAPRQCNQNEKSIRADQYAKSLMNKDVTSFWDSIRKSSNTIIPVASIIDNCTENIAYMWQDHYNSLLNSVKGNSSEQVIHAKLGTIPSRSQSILCTNSDLNSALKSLKRGKACGVDGLAAEHIIYAHSITHVFLPLLFNAFIRHGYLPTDFMKTAIVPIIKNKTRDTSDKTTTERSHWSLPHLNYLKFVPLKFYKSTSLHMIINLDLKQNTLLT